jgi:hypothetical protein
VGRVFSGSRTLFDFGHRVIDVLTVLIPFCFSFTALGHAERYVPAADNEIEKVG